MNLIGSKLSWKGDYSHVPPFCFVIKWISPDIVSLSGQSERAKKDIHWFGIYSNALAIILVT